MAKAVESKSDAVVDETADAQPQEIDSKYRLIIVAAQRASSYSAAPARASKSTPRVTSRRASRSKR